MERTRKGGKKGRRRGVNEGERERSKTGKRV